MVHRLKRLLSFRRALRTVTLIDRLVTAQTLATYLKMHLTHRFNAGPLRPFRVTLTPPPVLPRVPAVNSRREFLPRELRSYAVQSFVPAVEPPCA